MTNIAEKLGVADEVKAAKGNGCKVKYICIDERNYIYRSLNRMEWKKMQDKALKAFVKADGSIDQSKSLELRDRSEDLTVVLATIFPVVKGADDLAGWPAGDVASISGLIAEITGFKELDTEPVSL